MNLLLIPLLLLTLPNRFYKSQSEINSFRFLTLSFTGFRKVERQPETGFSFFLNSSQQVLEKLKANQRRDYLKGTVSGSVQATDRLMKELRDIYRSPSFKSGAYQVINYLFFCFKVHLIIQLGD